MLCIDKLEEVLLHCVSVLTFQSVQHFGCCNIIEEIQYKLDVHMCCQTVLNGPSLCECAAERWTRQPRLILGASWGLHLWPLPFILLPTQPQGQTVCDVASLISTPS